MAAKQRYIINNTLVRIETTVVIIFAVRIVIWDVCVITPHSATPFGIGINLTVLILAVCQKKRNNEEKRMDFRFCSVCNGLIEAGGDSSCTCNEDDYGMQEDWLYDCRRDELMMESLED